MSTEIEVECKKFYQKHREIAEKCHNGHFFEGFGGKMMEALCNVAFVAGANWAMAKSVQMHNTDFKKGERN